MKPLQITYYVHGTTTDNEKGLATGWAQGELSALGRKQCIELGNLVKSRNHEAVFCSDLKRAVESARLIFGSRTKLIEDRRLRECNYGDLTGAPSSKVDSALSRHISKPFPNGESCMDVEVRLKEFLKWLAGQPYRDVAIVAHKAPQLALEVLLNSKAWVQAIRDDWRLKEPKEWKPGWLYELPAAKTI